MNWVLLPARQATLAGGIDSLELIPVLLKSLKIRAQSYQLSSKSIWSKDSAEANFVLSLDGSGTLCLGLAQEMTEREVHNFRENWFILVR